MLRYSIATYLLEEGVDIRYSSDYSATPSIATIEQLPRKSILRGA
jgi:hypothetical protein